MTAGASAPVESRSRQKAQHAICAIRRPGDGNSGEQRQHSGVAIEPVARDLAVSEEADKREIAEALADQPGLDSRFTEQGRAPSDAADVDPGFRGPISRPASCRTMRAMSRTGALGIAAAEQDRIARGDSAPSTSQPRPGSTTEIAHQIIAGIRAGTGNPAKISPPTRRRSWASSGPISSMNTVVRGRPSITIDDVVPRLVDPATGPIGMQPWVRPGSDRDSGAASAPPRHCRQVFLAPEARASSGCGQRCDTRPPTRKAPLAAATSSAAFGRSGQRGSA